VTTTPSLDDAYSFANVAQRSASIILDCGGRSRAVDAPYDRNEVIRASGNLVVTFDAFHLGCGDVRIVRLFSNKVDVFTCFAYPDPASIAPTYAMEFVLIGGRPVVAVMDLLLMTPDAATESQLDAFMREVRRDYHGSNHQPVPDWYADCRSGRDVFVRPQSVDEFATFERMHLALFDQVCRWFTQHNLSHSQNAVAHGARLDEYKRHHCAHSPGLPIMERTFGASWTRQFMQDWVFRETDPLA
jgi:hypothetical protein